MRVFHIDQILTVMESFGTMMDPTPASWLSAERIYQMVQSFYPEKTIGKESSYKTRLSNAVNPTSREYDPRFVKIGYRASARYALASWGLPIPDPQPAADLSGKSDKTDKTEAPPAGPAEGSQEKPAEKPPASTQPVPSEGTNGKKTAEGPVPPGSSTQLSLPLMPVGTIPDHLKPLYQRVQTMQEQLTSLEDMMKEMDQKIDHLTTLFRGIQV